MYKVILALLFFIFGLLLFSSLSDHALCNDEASTAVMARNTLNFGYPRSFDGVNFHYPSLPNLILPKTYLWIADTWVQYYVIVLSFKLFGITTWSARFPFVLAGFLTLILLYIFCARYLKSRIIGLISIVLLGTSVPFLLHARQARYYALVILLSFIIFHIYHRIIEEEKGYLGLGLCLVILSITNHAVFATIFISIWIMALFKDRHRIRWANFIIVSLVSVLFLSVWLLVWWRTFLLDFNEYPLNHSLLQIKKNFEFQLRTINGYFIPVAFWFVVVAVFRFFRRHPIFRLDKIERDIFLRVGIILTCNIIFFSIFGMRTMRYYVHYLPFLCIIEAFLLYRIFLHKKSIALVIVLLVICTNFLARPNPLFLTKGFPAPFDLSKHSKFRTYFLNYLYELTHEYIGPLEALCDYLKVHAAPGDRIKIVKGDLTVIFYHPEMVILNDERYYKKSYPEWIVVRKYWNPIFEDIWRNKIGIDIEEGYLNVLERYEKIPLPAVDSIRENEPDNLETHFFRSPTITPDNQMFVYRLKEN